MNDVDPQIAEADELVDLLLADYFLRAENGEEIDRAAFVAAQTPEVARLLLNFFAVHDSLGDQISGLHQQDTAARNRETTIVSRFFEPQMDDGAPHPLLAADERDEALFNSFPVDLGPYRVLRQLGRGGTGTVFLALELSSGNRQVALKIPNAGRNCPRELVERLFREARLVKQLQHPNICEVYNEGTVNGLPFITMQYIEGQSLDLLLQQSSKPWPAAEIARLMLHAARALQAAHAKGIIHRDLKPSNFMVDGRGEPVLTDFGLALQYDDNAVSRLTRSSVIVGTLAYISPELARFGRPAVVPASDVYSLGVMFYEMLTGRRPFQDDEAGWFPPQLMWDRPSRPPAAIYPEVDPDLSAICLRMLEKNLQRRTQTADVVADQLTRWLAGERNFITAPAAHVDPAETVEWPLARTSREVSPAAFSKYTKILAAVLGLAAVVVAFLVIRVQTDRGELLITSPEANLDIAIRRNGVDVKEFKLTAGKNDVSVFSGEVEVVIRGAAADQYRVKHGKFTLTRGGRMVVNVERIETPLADTENVAQKTSGKPAGPAAVIAPQITGDFVPLFNGKDTAGWILDGSKTSAITVNDGVLTAANGGPPNFWDHLITTRTDFTNFHLRCQFKKDDIGRGLPSVLVRVDPSPVVFGGMRGYLVRIDKAPDGADQETGNVVSLHLSSRIRNDYELAKSNLPTLAADAWHTLEIITNGTQIDVLVDGQSALSYRDAGETFQGGAVALRLVDGAKNMYREVAIKELPPSPRRDAAKDSRRRWKNQELSGNQWNETWRVFQHATEKQWFEAVCSHPNFERYAFTEIGRTDEYIELERAVGENKVIVRIYSTYFEQGPTREQLRRGASGEWEK